jgi:hypothetical protein
MSIAQQHTLLRRNFCICCAAVASFAKSGLLVWPLASLR